MGYLHIDNLYKNQDIFLFKHCWALEKVHGTSAHISFRRDRVPLFHFSSGGEKYERFRSLFDGDEEMLIKFKPLPYTDVVLFGEAYGGKQQGMRDVYGPDLKFIVFDIKADDVWLDVPVMASLAASLGFEVVPMAYGPAELAFVDAERDRPSEVAKRNGMGEDKPREGVVLRPAFEVVKQDGTRVITKHKQEAFSERATPQKIVDPAKLSVLAEASAIADEWVTPMRLAHVLQKLPGATDMKHIPTVIAAMLEDVTREAKGEIVESKDATAAISKKTVALFKRHLHSKVQGA